MSASRKRPKGAVRRSFGLFMSCVVMMPTSVGRQDLAALIARQPGVAERGREHIRTATTMTTLHTATFSFPRPVGTLIPDAPGYQLASLDPRALDLTSVIPGHDPFEDHVPPAPRYEFPSVDRSRKGDILIPRDRLPVPAEAPKAKPQPEKAQDTASASPAAIEAVSPNEPFAIPQKLIAEAARIAARRLAAEKAEARRKAAEAAKRDAVLLKAGIAEPFAIPHEAIVEAARIETSRLVTVPEKVEAQAQVQAELPRVEMPDFSGWAGPFAEAFAVPQHLIDESEQIAIARETPDDRDPVDVAAAERTEDEAIEAGAGIPVVENDKILTDEEPRDDESDVAVKDVENPAMQAAKLYFGAETFGETLGGLEAYGPGEAPTFDKPTKVDPDIKLSALPSGKTNEPPAKTLDEKPAKESTKESVKDTGPNETIAPKGEVTGAGQRPRTPAERLSLTGAGRAKQERCLANAIYFESRGEPERGQMAVAQVVMNRVFSPYYPVSVCGVVYQNAHKHNACQFTFACDSVRDVVTEPDAWETAKRIARETLDGKMWLPEIGKATHYHATYVSPWWKRTMTKYKTVGVHIFYRPKRWGDGSDEPTWDPAQVEATGSIKVPDKSRADAFNKS